MAIIRDITGRTAPSAVRATVQVCAITTVAAEHVAQNRAVSGRHPHCVIPKLGRLPTGESGKVWRIPLPHKSSFGHVMHLHPDEAADSGAQVDHRYPVNLRVHAHGHRRFRVPPPDDQEVSGDQDHRRRHAAVVPTEAEVSVAAENNGKITVQPLIRYYALTTANEGI
jgi:hypothetical protein